MAAFWTIAFFASIFFVVKPQKRWSLVSTRAKATVWLIIAIVSLPLAVDTPTAKDMLPAFLVIDLIIFFVGFALIGRKQQRAKAVATASYYQDKANAVSAQLEAEFPYIFWESGAALCMDGAGQKLRLVQLDQGGSEITAELMVGVTDIVSVELVKHEDTVGESTTVTRKQGALTRAVVGDLLFGSTGAIVGSVSAGSKSKTITQERRVYRFSELVFGLSDFRNPVVRFSSTDHDECDRWLHRIRAALAKSTAAHRAAPALDAT